MIRLGRAGLRLAIAACALALAAPLSAQAQRIGEGSGVDYAKDDGPVEGPKTIGGEEAFISPVPYFRDLGAWDPDYDAPRTAFGAPDLQGVWTTASLTTLTRGASGRAGADIETLVIPTEQVEDYANRTDYVQIARTSQLRTDPDAGAFTDRNPGAGYNAFWIDPGSEYGKVNGEYRSSWVVYPEDGQIPYSAEGREARAARMSAARGSDNTGPEIRTIGDRCLTSFSNQGGPPITNTMYNNHIQIAQSPDHIMMNIEMNHDARIIRIVDGPQDVSHRPDEVAQWFGDSVGWWEGDTLVVQTRNLHDLQAYGRIPLSEQGVATERFTRVSDQELFYEYTINDPVNYTSEWRGEMPIRLTSERLHEYACHEGNYALPGILRGMVMGIDTALDAEGE